MSLRRRAAGRARGAARPRRLAALRPPAAGDGLGPQEPRHARGRRLGPSPRFGRAVLVAQIAAALVFAAALLHAEGVRPPFADGDAWRLQAQFADAGGLQGGRHAPVLVSGVPSGRVEDVRYERGRAVATLRLDGAARGIVRTDAVARIEPRSALQDLTVDLDPGSASAPAARDGGRIGPARTQGTVTLDRVVATLDADTRTQLAILLDQLAAGLADRPGALRDAIARLRPAVDSAARLTGALDERRALLARLVTAVDRIARASGGHAASLRAAIRDARATLAVTGRRRGAVRATVAELPATLTALDRALRRTLALAEPLDPALVRLRPAVRALPAALAGVRETAPPARALIGDLGALARAGAAPAADLRRTLTQLGPVARAVRRPVEQLRPIVAAIDARGQGIGDLGERFSGVLSTNDANGAILRGLGFFEPFDPANFGAPGARGAQLARVRRDAARALTRTCTGANPVACLVRYLVPGLPDAVRSTAQGLKVRPR